MRLLYGDPDELDRLADTLRARATEVRDRADQQLRRAEAAEWVSVSAQAYRQRLRERRTQAYQVAESLEEAADGLVAHAQEVRDRIAAIARIEQQVTEWIGRRASAVADAVRSGVGQVVDGLPWTGGSPAPEPPAPDSLPPPGDKSWLDVGESLRRQGVL